MFNIMHDIAEDRITPDKFDVVIEISKGSKVKYELDKDTGMIMLDRILHTSTVYPANYGFIPRTFADDGDPLDALVLCSETIIPNALVKCHAIGVVYMVDGGDKDEKIIVVPEKDPFFKSFKDVSELPAHVVDEICHFFSVYKALEHKETEITGTGNAEDAKKIIVYTMEQYKKKYC